MGVRALAAMFGVLVALTACADAAPSGPAAGSPSRPPFGRAFDATGATEAGRERLLVVKAAIEFGGDGSTTVRTGCNGARATTRLRDGRLVSDGFTITEIGCRGDVADQERFVMSIVRAEPAVLLDGHRLVLRTDAGEIRFLDRRVADPDRPLEQTRWQVTGTFDTQVASSAPDAPGELILSVGRARYGGPCQDFEGPAAVTGTSVTFGTLGRGGTRPCRDDQKRYEEVVLAVLDGPVRAEVGAGGLRLVHPLGSGMSLVAAP